MFMARPALCIGISGKAQGLAWFFGATPGVFFLYDRQSRRHVRYNEANYDGRFTPFSTLKTPRRALTFDRLHKCVIKETARQASIKRSSIINVVKEAEAREDAKIIFC